MIVDQIWHTDLFFCERRCSSESKKRPSEIARRAVNGDPDLALKVVIRDPESYAFEELQLKISAMQKCHAMHFEACMLEAEADEDGKSSKWFSDVNCNAINVENAAVSLSAGVTDDNNHVVEFSD
ncbi:hypothetical protein MRB53_038547 [Persea americana]|nr:hypothetical protein MRB53_038547 [Persea americana]